MTASTQKGLPGLVGHTTTPGLRYRTSMRHRLLRRVLGCIHVLTFGPIGDPEGSL